MIHIKENLNSIPGIYNYCDRWCERCEYTCRCRVYAMDQADTHDHDSQDIRGREFNEKLHDVFSRTMEILSAIVREEGIDLSASDQDEEAGELIRASHQAFEHPIARETEKYSTMVTNWFAENESVFQEQGATLEKEFKLGIGQPESASFNIINLKARIEGEFPNARMFVRPGFDQEM